MKPILKRTLPRLLFALTMLLFLGTNRDSGLRAQNIIGFSQSGWSGMPQSVYAGDTAIAGAFITNISNFIYPLGDTIQVVGYIDTLSGPVTQLDTLSFDSISLLPHDSIFFIEQIIFRDNYQQGSFRIGSNVIVVWPIMLNPSFSTGDSLTVTVLVIDTINSTGPERPEGNDIKCYPVPSSGPLYITSSNRSTNPSSVVVHDSSGKIICVSSSLSNGINTESWAPGIYLIEITFDDNTKSSIKIIRQ